MKRLVAILCVMLLLCLVGCNQPETPTPTVTPQVTPTPSAKPQRNDWDMPQEVYKDLEAFELDESKTYKWSMLGMPLVQENESYELYISEYYLSMALVHKQSGQVWYSGNNPTNPQLRFTVTDKTNAQSYDLNSVDNCAELMESATKYNLDMLPYYLTKNQDGNLRIQYIMGNVVKYAYVVPSVMPAEVHNWMEHKAAEIYKAINTDENGNLVVLSPLQKDAKAKELYGYEALWHASPLLVRSVFTSMNAGKYAGLSQSEKEEYDGFVPGLYKLGQEYVAVQRKKYSPYGPYLEALFAVWFEENKDSALCQGYSTPEQLCIAWELPYMVDRNLKLAVAVDYKLTEDGLEITASEPIYDTVTYEISSFSLLGGQQSESFEFKKADNGRSATVKYNG